MAVNARGMVACVKHAVNAMVEGHVRGSIICTASVVATRGTKNTIDYTMPKHAVLGLVRSASLQVDSYGIRVNCVSPGSVGTQLMKDMLKTEDDEEADKAVESTSNLKGGRVLMPKNVADAVVFLASEDSQFVTCHNLEVHAGFKFRDD
ncbi:short-chain dehydrogenase reductase 3a [Quercus suber]|uniref:Short-chain dehydrogenase reductase 3a n=1 Tax=Quercus suber TaxID=58331 RepID=A0AAW0KHF8_QUESU